MLKSEGFTVFGAESASKAMGYVDENIDVVLTDLQMGDVSGLELLRFGRSDARKRISSFLPGIAA